MILKHARRWIVVFDDGPAPHENYSTRVGMCNVRRSARIMAKRMKRAGWKYVHIFKVIQI